VTSAEWDMTVPADDAELLAEFRRHGVRPGSRLHVILSDESEVSDSDQPAYFGSFSGPSDLGERSEEILRAEFPPANR
jgi:hypothetical protein